MSAVSPRDIAGAKVGFIGLGRMGSGMSASLVKGGADVTVYDPVPAAVEKLVQAGARAADSIAELTRDADVIFSSLPGPEEIEAVVLGEGGVLENVRPGTTYIDHSTNSLSLARQMHASFAEVGCETLDAPVSGQPAGAAAGTLAIWVGGERDCYERNVELLNAVGSSHRYVGLSGAGIVTKLAHNMTGYMLMLSMAESFSVAVKAGVDPLELWDALHLGVIGKAPVLDMLINQFLPGEYESPMMTLKLAHKDVRLATSVARELGVPTRISALTMEEMTEAIAAGYGDGDSRSYLQLQLQRAGVEIAVDRDRIDQVVKKYRD